MKYLYLDDFRDPSATGNYMLPVDLRAMYRKENWEIVRNYKQFTEWITSNGLPDVVSFDHDLADVHYGGGIETFEYQEETGLDCAKWMIDYCIQNNLDFPEYYIHSMNPVGAENILNYIENFKKSRK